MKNLNPLSQINKAMSTVTESIDDNIYSAEEMAKEKTERLKIDNASTSIIPQLIRPVSFGWSILMLSITNFIVIRLSFQTLEGLELVAAIGVVSTTWSTLVGMMAKFYFEGRSDEKIQAKKADIEVKLIKASIELESNKQKHEIDKEVLKDKNQERAERRAARKKNR